MPKVHIQRWHGAHHYSDKVHLLLVVFIFFGIFTFLWSYFTLSSTLKIAGKNAQSPVVTLTPTPSQTLTPTPTCKPRPACLDTTPRCLMPETDDMCPPTIAPVTKPADQVFCTQDARLCSDGKTWVSRTGPNCEFSACPPK